MDRPNSASLALAALLALLPLAELGHYFHAAERSAVLVPEQSFNLLRRFEPAARALRIRGGMQGAGRGRGGSGSSSSNSKGEHSDTESSSSDYEDGGGGGETGGGETAAAPPERKFAWEAVFGASTLTIMLIVFS